jgi:glycosidase
MSESTVTPAQDAASAQARQFAISPRSSALALLVDARSGLPSAIVAPSGEVMNLALGIEIESEGVEVPGTMGGLTYRDTERHQAFGLVPGSFEHDTAGPEEAFCWQLSADDLRVRLEVAFREKHPRLEFRIALEASADQERVIRDLHLKADLSVEDPRDWLLEAPGNTLRSGVSAADVSEAIPVRTAGDHLGSPGFVVLHTKEPALSLLLWPMSAAESGEVRVEPLPQGLRWGLRTELAGVVSPGEWLEHGPIYCDLIEQPWATLRDEINRWYRSIGITTPPDQPAWASTANIFEVMVGSAPFRGGIDYSPYPEPGDLLADLDRIEGLGFDCLQLMPRHPYPSYNIHAPGDVATTYGSPKELRALVEACHERGMRVVLDILMHGVLDKASIRRALAVVEEGPHTTRLDEPCSDPYTADSEEISWCRHIVEFGPYWLEGSLERHPLLDEHPDWFMRDSSGAVTGVYTNALDPTNERWQDHFVGTCAALVADLGIDGFRLDAPLYNRHANWSPATRRHASYACLGSRRLLRKLRRRLRAISSDLLVYTEPSGPLIRESVDLCYAYEEKWLPESLFPEATWTDRDWRRVSTGRQLADWCRDFDAAMPPGSVFAHFLDAHDTMWWRLPSDWWRRDQIGLPATKALVAIYALRGGAYMTFVGGEEGLEDELRLVHTLRRCVPEIATGDAHYETISVDDEAVYGVVRRSGSRTALIAVNLSDAAVNASITVSGAAGLGSQQGRVFDAWAGEWLPTPALANNAARFDLSFYPYQPRVILGEPPQELL